MDKYCQYCYSKIFENDRTCPQCGAPTMNYIVGLDIFGKTEKKTFSNRENRSYDIKNIESFFPYSDIRIMSKGDSSMFDISTRDIFCTLKTKGNSITKEIKKNFQGQFSIIPELDFFTKNDISFLFSSVVSIVSSNDNNNTGTKISGNSSSGFIRLSQQVSAWNGGAKTIAVGTYNSFAHIFPYDTNYRYTLSDEPKIEFGKLYQTDFLMLPSAIRYETSFDMQLKDDQIWMVSPTEGKLLKMVFENESLDNVGIGIGINSVCGIITV
jgi:hypothetical protein